MRHFSDSSSHSQWHTKSRSSKRSAASYFADVLFEPDPTVGRGETPGGFGPVFSETLFL